MSADQSCEVWPECWPIFSLFCRLQTQWRVSHAGPTGLDYLAAYPLLDRLAESPDDWDQLLDDLRALEIAALEQMRENKD